VPLDVVAFVGEAGVRQLFRRELILCVIAGSEATKQYLKSLNGPVAQPR
jgi:hypothetical protein